MFIRCVSNLLSQHPKCFSAVVDIRGGECGGKVPSQVPSSWQILGKSSATNGKYTIF